MPFTDIVIPTIKIDIPRGGGSFTVRGLGFEDISLLFASHQAAMTAMFNQYVADESKTGKSVKDTPPETIASGLIKDAPQLAAAVIAVAGDDPSKTALISKLPFPVQIEALKAIGELTFSTEGGVGKVIETVIQVVGGATALVKGKR